MVETKCIGCLKAKHLGDCVELPAEPAQFS